MKRERKWFQKAVARRPPNSLGGWSKSLSAEARRRKALASRPRTWKLSTRYLSAARALQALANVTRDAETKRKALADAKYFYERYHETKRRGR